jgi:glycosyltransferase involved in cell wall biosynthesis
MHFLREATVNQGHQMDLIFADDVPDPFNWCGLTGVTFPFLMLLTMRRLVQQNGPYDIVNIHTLGGAVYVFLRKLFKRLPKCVIVSYGADELRWEFEKEEDRLGLKRLGLKSRVFYYNLIIRQARYATRWADHVFTAARSEKEFYINAYGRTPESITFIPHGVGKEFFFERVYSHAPTRLLFFGGWEWRKGTRYLVEAFSNIAGEYPNVTLSVGGTGEGAGLVKKAFPASLHNRVRIIPRVPAEEVPKVYMEHDIFVLPSLFESMSLAVPEAMASGMPIVTTQACGRQDIIEDGVTGLLVPPRDADTLAKQIMMLLNDPALCERLGRAAQEKAREITWDRIARQTLQVYERLLDKTGHTT